MVLQIALIKTSLSPHQINPLILYSELNLSTKMGMVSVWLSKTKQKARTKLTTQKIFGIV